MKGRSPLADFAALSEYDRYQLWAAVDAIICYSRADGRIDRRPIGRLHRAAGRQTRDRLVTPERARAFLTDLPPDYGVDEPRVVAARARLATMLGGGDD